MEPVPLSALLAAKAPDSPLGAFVPPGCQKILAIGLREFREADLSFELEIRGQAVLKVTLLVREGQLRGGASVAHPGEAGDRGVRRPPPAVRADPAPPLLEAPGRRSPVTGCHMTVAFL